MPHANIWIRKDDWETWQALENKSEAIHNLLNSVSPVSPRGNEQHPAVVHNGVHRAPSALNQAVKAFNGDCKHLNVNKRTGICSDCGEYTR